MTSDRLSPEKVGELARSHFGLDGDITELGSNEDQNFLLQRSDAGPVVLKLTRSSAPDALELQSRALRHVGEVSRAAGLRSPKVHRSLSGETVVAVELDSGPARLRVLDFLTGQCASALGEMSPRTAVGIGRAAGVVNRALSDLEPPPGVTNERWDLRRGVAVVRSMLPSVEPSRRVRLEAILASVEEWMAPRVDRLPVQLVHGDITADNVVVDDAGDVVGVIDFGDLAAGWRVAEIAVAATSTLRYGPDAAARALDVIRAFDELVPLTDDELAVVWPLVTLRAAVLAASGAEIAAADPENVYARVRRPFEDAMLEGAMSWGFEEAMLLIAQALGRVGEPVVAGALLASAVPVEAVIDLSVWSPFHDDGRWQDAAEGVRALRAAHARHGAAATRYGEHRLRPQLEWGPSHARTLALGVDVALDQGTPLLSFGAGRVASVAEDSMAIKFSGVVLHLDGVVAEVAPGDRVVAGAVMAHAGGTSEDAPIVHVQLCALADIVPPRFAHPGLEAAWRQLCPDPSPLLGLVPTTDSHRESHDLLVARKDHYANVQGHYYADPPQIERGWRHTLIDTLGRTYIDMVNNVALVGHGHPRIADAAASQLRRLNTNSRFHYEALAEFVAALTAKTPAGLDTVFLVNSGSEAVDLALRLAQVATGRRDVVALREAYHGWAMGSDAVSSSVADNPRAPGTRPEWVHLLPAPHRLHPSSDDPLTTPLDVARRHLEELDARGTEIAAFISEPIFGNGGGVLLPDGYLAEVWEHVRARGGLCIADEVQVGYGRLGRFFWGFEQQGVVPDIITMAKAMGNGHPLGAVITTRAIADAFARDGSFFSSAGGSTLSCVVGTTVLRTLETEGLQANALEVGNYLAERLRALSSLHDCLGQLHGMGLYLGLEVVSAADPNRADADATKGICDDLLAEGIILQRTGDLRNVLKIKPPLTIDRAAVDHFVSALDRVVRLRVAHASLA